METDPPSRRDDNRQIDCVILCCDFLATRESEQISNLRWLEDLLARPMAAALPSATMRIGTTPGFRRADVLNGVVDTKTLTERHCRFDTRALSDAAIAIIEAEFGRNSLFVGYELSQPTRAVLDRANIPWIDIWLHPVRFADDILFAFRASDPDVQARLDTFSIQEDALFAQADLLKIQNYRGFAKFDARLVDGAAVFAGQMARDKSVLSENGFLGLLDFEEAFVELTRHYPHLYFAPHPNEPRLGRETRAFLDGFRNVSMTDAPMYHLMADRRIVGVAAISSSVLEEARYFGKAVHRFAPPPFPLSGQDRYVPVFQAFCFPHFWAEILGGLTPTHPSEPGAFLDPKNKLRQALSFYWGYRHIDRTEAIAGSLTGETDGAPKPTIETADLVSFDVFDTLITRKVSTPDDIFALIASESAPIADLKTEDFVIHRKEAELKARQSAERAGREDPTHVEIYATLLGAEATDPRVAQLCQLEFEAEKGMMLPRPAGAALYKRAQQAGRRIVLASDMYLPSEKVATLLRQCGYEGWDALYLSSELGLTKRSGTLFSCIIEDTGVPAASILHIGDNSSGDIRVPEALGLTCHPLPKPIDVMRNAAPFLRSGTRQILATPAREGRDVAARIALEMYDNPGSLVSNSDAFGRDAHAFGYATLGPLLAGFAGWLHERAIARGIEQLGFLTREGPVLRAAYETLFPDGNIAVETVFASRRIAAAAMLATPADVEERLQLAIGGRYAGPEELLAIRFGLSQSEIDPEALAGSGISGPIDVVTDKTALRQLVKAHEGAILARSKAARDALANYLRDTGMSGTNAAIVDIGYAGRIQAAYARISGTDLAGFYLATHRTARTVLEGLHAEAYLASDADPTDKRFGINRHRRVYETLLCAPGPSFVGIHRGDDGWHGVTETGADTPVRDAFVTRAHAGALAFVRDYADSQSALHQSAATAMLDATLDDPSDGLLEWLGELEFGDAYDGPGVQPLIGAAGSGVWHAKRSTATAARRPRRVRGPRWQASGPYGLLGWRHALTPVVAFFVNRIGDPQDADHYRDDPIGFFRRLSDPRYRRIGRLLYPWD